MDSIEASGLIDTLDKAAKNLPDDVEERRRIYKAAKRLMLSAETPHETTQRVYYGGLPLHLAIIAIDLGLFKILSSSQETMHTLTKLAERVGSDDVLLHRILRGLVSYGLVGESQEGQYYANHFTKLFAMDGVEAGAKHGHLHVNPALQCLPDFLKKTNYCNPNDSKNLPFQMVHNTDQTAFEWLSHRPENLKWTIAYMATQRASQKGWICEPELFPTKDFTIQPGSGDQEACLFVDVGGGAGHQCIALRQTHPNLDGRVVLQDLPGTVAMADQATLQSLRIEPMAQDFMTPQPVKGAKVYYMRNILHDWPDATCLTILKHLRDAMGPSSVIMVDEIVVQQSESTWKQVNYDIVMMCALGGMERIESQWKQLLSDAGLELREVIEYDGETGDSILIAGSVQ